MKKEGRQNGIGMVPWSPRSGPSTSANKLSDSPPTAAGLLLRVSPTRIRSKCGGKAKDKAKAKGTQKLRSRDVVVSSYRLTTWRVADGGPGFKFSESGSLDYFPPGLIVDLDFVPSPLSVEIEADDYGDLDGGDEVDDDAMSFCEVGFLWEQVEGDEVTFVTAFCRPRRCKGPPPPQQIVVAGGVETKDGRVADRRPPKRSSEGPASSDLLFATLRSGLRSLVRQYSLSASHRSPTSLSLC
nr:Hop-interacting protein THI031 [Ipomoea batatas]GMD01184.1 Hop-interacting protein THI031 [Ipomoea batatas]